MKMERKSTGKLKNGIFMDSGAHGLFNEYVKDSRNHSDYSFYKTKIFWDYVDSYAIFMKKNKTYFSLFANVDVIYNPKMTWEVQEYIERKYNLIPLPVIHYGTNLKWLRRYLSKGYSYIALGGVGQGAGAKDYVVWADAAFDIICNQPSRFPKVKVHGFAITSQKLMSRYPWYSVDSTTWLKIAAFGSIFVPFYKNGKWDYSKQYRRVLLSTRPPAMNKLYNINDAPFDPNSSHIKDKITCQYIKEKGFIIGKANIRKVPKEYTLKKNEEKQTISTGEPDTKYIKVIEEAGLSTDGKIRACLNAIFFIDFAKHAPKWPWAFEGGNVNLII